MTAESKIGIIGGGISGIAEAKQLREYEPVVFEATDSIGGRGNNSCSFPSYKEVLEYLHSYATHFDVLKLVKFNSKVWKYVLSGSWRVVWIRISGDMYWKIWGHPFDTEIPENKGPEVFQGKVVHTLDYCKLDQEESTRLLKGNKVLIVGYKKSAIDLAVECAEANQGADGQACTMVVRTLHWTVPHYSVWGLPFYMFYSTRASQFLHQRPNQGFFRTLLCHMLSPMRRTISKVIEWYLTWKLPLEKYGLKPDHPFEEDYASCQMAILPENFFSEADKGKIGFKRLGCSKWWFWEGGIELEDGSRLDADVVVLATGFDGKHKLKAIVPDPFRSLLEFPSGMMPLYRGTINPMIPNIAFVGYIESVSNLHTAELRCKWLSRLVDDKFKLPSIEKMVDQIGKEMEIMRKATRFYKRSCISTFSINHSDEICEEMGWRSWRKNSCIAEAFSPYNAHDYREDE
ncbi:putative flavin-containing monooxygenase 1 [Sesamum angolense]|uniref:Flavin-containing monooxygenase n=1 Tax=Sesamum angolense TaxID=2727404 RepID=A0AAE1WES3_9LAMI|nr:putative flavin-containing monooxygenase 1 [Sesamum angolense]